MHEVNFEQFARIVADPLLLVSSDGVILDANTAAARLVGNLSPGETRLHGLLGDPPEHLDRYLKLCGRSLQPVPGALRWKTPEREMELRCDGGVLQPRAGDSPALILLHCRPKGHAVEQFKLLNQKIAELTAEILVRREAQRERDALLESERSARHEAEAASRLKDDFIATLSHELRTPISAILGWSQVMRASTVAREQVSEGLAVIERNARAQARLIEDLLDMSRIMSGKLRLDLQAVNLGSVIDAAVQSVQPAAQAKNIRVNVMLDPIAGPVRGDPERLQQIVWNVLTNAVKFTPKGGRVQVVLERVNSHLEISVTDNGAGIKPEFLPHLFQRFRQADSSTTRQHPGLGLGLAIVKHLTELHGGTVRAKSPGEHQGSTFTVSLPRPLVQMDVTEGQRIHPTSGYNGDEATGECSDLTGIRVLLVDDEPDGRDVARMILEQCGAIVEAVEGARTALARLQDAPPDVLLSDIGMPDMDGFDLIQAVRKLPAKNGGRVPAAALTAFARSVDRRRSLLAGYQMHVAKPIEPAELVAVVASLAGRTQRDEPANPPAP